MTGLTGSAIRGMLELTSRRAMISFAGGLPPAEAFDMEGIRLAVSDALSPGRVEALQYGLTCGAGPLLDAIAKLMIKRGIACEPADLLVTTGSQQAIALVSEAVLNPGDIVAVERPTYPAMLDVARLRQARVITAASDNEGIDVEELENRIRGARPKLLYLVPTFGNPSGAVLSRERRLRILELAVRYDFLILEDDPYSELYFDEPPPPPLAALAGEVEGAKARCAYCSSFSKILAPGLRLGWLLAPPEVVRAACIIKQVQDAHTSTLAQYAAAAYLESNRLERHLPRLRALYRARANAMVAAMHSHLRGALTYTPPRGGMFIWLRLNHGIDALQLFNAACEGGVAFVPGAAFMAEYPDRCALRLSYASPDISQIDEGMARLAAALEGISPC
ncbi:MAG: PLP-dependent aminotransferase family protein [Terriglobales bacterium]|jgi:DNA-binding transcriptional MocR family regulator